MRRDGEHQPAKASPGRLTICLHGPYQAHGAALSVCRTFAQLLQDLGFKAGNLHLGDPHFGSDLILRFIRKITQQDDRPFPRFQRAEQFL